MSEDWTDAAMDDALTDAVLTGDVPKGAEPHRRRRWRKRWIILLAAVLLLAGWFGRFAHLRMTLRPTPRTAYWQAQLEALDPPGPGAIRWAEVSKLVMNCPKLGVPPPPTTQGRVGPDGNPLPPTPGTGFVPASPQPPDVRNVLEGPWDESRPVIKAAGQLFSSETFKSSREAMRKAVEAGWWDDTISVVPGPSLGVYREYREWARYLVAHSRWAREHEGDARTAIDDWLMTLQLARQLRRTHDLLSELVGTAIDGLVAEEIGLAAREGFVGGDAVTLANQIEALRGGVEARLDSLSKASRIRDLYRLESYFVRDGGNWMDVSELASLSQAMNFGGAAAPASRLWNLASPLFNDYETARQNAERRWASVREVTDLRTWMSRCNRVKKNDPRPWTGDILDGQMFSDVDGTLRCIALCYDSTTHLEASVTMLALAEYRRKQGHYPDTLGELVPGFMPRLPVDYADRGVLRYRREGDEYVLYGIGPNGVDDGGQCTNPSRPLALDDNLDLVYTKTSREKETE